MTEPLVITHSDIAAYMKCRRAWVYDFVMDYRKPEVLFGALACGTRIHKALEHYYKTNGDPVAEHERLFRRDHDILEADPDCPPWGMDQLYEDCIFGRNAVAAHQDWLETTGADANYSVEAVEQMIEAPMLDGKIMLRGKVDVLFRRLDNGFLVLNDWKSDGGMLGLIEQLERSWQHACYLITLRLLHPDEFVQEAHYTILKKVKNPKRVKTPMVERIRVPGTSRMADNKMRQLEVVLEEMLAAVDTLLIPGNEHHAYPQPSPSCRFCDFKHVCTVAEESTEAAVAMLDAQFVKGGRHARYR